MLNIKRTMEYFQLIPPVVYYSDFDKRLLKSSVSSSPILTNWSVSLPNIGIKTSQIWPSSHPDAVFLKTKKFENL